MRILLSDYLQLQQNVAQITQTLTEEDIFDEPHLLLDLDSYLEQPQDLSIKKVVQQQQMSQCRASLITQRRTSVVTELENAQTFQHDSAKFINYTFDPAAMITVRRTTITSKQQVEEHHDVETVLSQPKPIAAPEVITVRHKTITSKEQVEEQHDVTEVKPEPKPVPIFVHLSNVPKNFEFIVHFQHHDVKWYTEFYKSYEGKMWHKTPRESEKRYQRWYYHCSLCTRMLSAFSNLRYHLNNHLGFLPYRCMECTKRYASGGSLNKHKIVKHRKF